MYYAPNKKPCCSQAKALEKLLFYVPQSVSFGKQIWGGVKTFDL